MIIYLVRLIEIVSSGLFFSSLFAPLYSIINHTFRLVRKLIHFVFALAVKIEWYIYIYTRTYIVAVQVAKNLSVHAVLLSC